MNKRLYILLVLISILLISVSRVWQLDGLRKFSGYTIGPVSYGLYRIGYQINQGVNFLISLPNVYSVNKELSSQVIALKEKLVDWERVKSENEALRLQLNVQGANSRPTIMASVTGITQKGNSIVIIVNKGSEDGVKQGSIATLNNRLVGQITYLDSSHAEILPIFAIDSKIPVDVVSKDGVRVGGLAKGVFNNRIMLDEVTQDVSLNVGDIVVTSGDGGLFPKGLLVGEIEKVISLNSEIFQSAELKSFWILSDLKIVFIEI